MEHKWLRKITALLLTLALSVQLASPAFAAVVQEENGNFSIVDANGNVIDSKSQKEWEEAYPYGVFAFKETQVNLKEGSADGQEKGTLTLYRLGGTEGRAEALVVLVPAAAQIEEDRMSYANAAGTQDYKVTVEDPWPCAQYQALGGTGEIIRAGGAITTVTDPADPSEESPAEEISTEEESRAEEDVLDEEETPAGDAQPEAALTTRTLVAPVKDAESYQWQMQIKLYNSYVQRWSDIKDATDAEMVVSPELLKAVMGEGYTYDFRCFYEADGVKYCSESWQGEAYEPEAEDIPPVMPQDFVDDHTRTDTTIAFDGGEYDCYSFLVVFADGEWEKEITFEALDDDLHECGEVVNAVVMESRGAEVYSNACTASIAIEDDEPEIPSAMGFAETEIWADKSAGTVRIPLMRESEGLQYVTGVDYETENGTAVAGTDYAAISSGTALFPSDLDFTYIEIDLVNDGILLEQKDSELFFTVKLTAAKGGGESTLLEGKDTITVHLYNSCEGTDVNLTTALYSPDEEDLTGAVEDTSAIVPAGGSVAAAAVTPGENAQGEYIADGAADSGISTYSYTYPGALTFSNGHGGSFWTNNAALASEDVSGRSGAKIPGESDDLESFVANAASLWSTGSRVGSTGWQYATDRGGDMKMTVQDMYDRYSSVTVNTYTRSERSAKGWYGANDWSNALFSTSGENGFIEIHSDPGANTWEFHANTRSSSSADQLWFRQHYTGSSPKGDATCRIQLLNGYMTRRTIKAPIVRIHTADDDYLQANAASLHEAIKPEISLIAGKGGTTADGSRIYNNSQVKVTRGDNASAYTFATQANGELSSKSLFFGPEDAVSSYPKATANVPTSGSGTLTLMMPGSSAAGKQGYINVVMDREQTLSLEIAPSVPRLSQEDSTTINPEQIEGTWNNLWEKSARNGGVTYTYREVNWDFSDGKDGFSDEKTGTLAKDVFSGNSSLYQSGTKLKNVRSINFHLDADDVILVNGIAYAGNEDIPIPANQYLNNNITFYYYDADYVTSENTMLATISRIERYIDLDDDGVVNGTINPVTGEFVPADGESVYDAGTNTGTYYVLPSLTDSAYSISQLAPRLGADGKYHQIVLKVYYSMLPRSLVVPAGASSSDTAEMIPAVVTTVTSASARSSMSDEQLGYRYIDHGDTGSGKPMYEAKASAISTVDIPLGGDYNPATVTGESITWEPQWKGNPYPGTEFTDPQPIYLNGTVLGDRYAVGEVDASGALTAGGKTKVAGYLSSMQENDTFTLCVRETPKSSGGTTYGLRSEPVQYLAGVESSRLASTATYPSSISARNLTDPDPGKEAGFDSSNAHSPMSEYDMTGDINLPELELGITDFASVSTNGQELAISVGANIFGVGMESDFENQQDKSFGDAETNALSDANGEAIETIKQAYNSLFGKRDPNTGRSEGYRNAMEDYADKLDKAMGSKGNGSITSKGVEAGLAVNITLLLKWDPIENRFFFNQLMVVFAAELEFSYTVYLTPCPIFYCSVSIGFGLEVAAGLEASRVKVMAAASNLTDSDVSGDGWTYYTGQEHMGYDELDEPEEGDFLAGSPGSSFTYSTKEKAIDIYFSGTLYVEVVGDQPEGFTPGTIRSAGDEAVTIKLAKKVDGKDNSKNYTLKFTVVNDDKTRNYDGENGYTQLHPGCAIVDRIVAIDRQTSDVYFSGISISPEASLEVAVGMGIEIVKVELFINVSVGCSFAVLAHDSADYDGEGAENHNFVFNEFSMAAGVGFRVAALLFSFEFNAIQFTITYDRETKYDEDTNKKTGWNFMWYAANQQIQSYGLRGDDNILKVNIILPGELMRDEAVFTPEDNLDTGITTFAFKPSDNTVPFQYSGYGSTGDAFTLGSGLASGSTYELVTAGGANYIVYTVTDSNQDSINQSRVVLSKVQETALRDEDGELISDEAYGLVHPTDSNADTPYLVLDNDANGDLDFDAWVDDSDVIHVAWVSYTDKALDAYEDALDDGDAIDAMEAAGKNTEVKTVTVDVSENGDGKGTVKTVSDKTGDHGMYYMPSGAGDMVFYAEAIYYAEDELNALLDSYKDYYGKTNYGMTSNGYVYGEGDPSANYQMTMKRMRAQAYGKSFYPTFAVPDQATGSYTVSKVTAQDWIENGVQIENASLAQVDSDYYAAYTTAQSALTANGEDEQTIKKLYLQKLTLDDAGKAVPGSAIALRKLVDNAKDNSDDGVYASGSCSEAYRDPYFSNIRFLNGKLGGLNGEDENFNEQIAMQAYSLRAAAETFLIFEMNGNTYVVPQESLAGITGEGKSGSIIPFFTRETVNQLGGSDASTVKGAPAVTNVTFGTDGSGNITAVYTRGENGAPGNAVYLTKYDPQSQTWGLGTRLAMRDMDTIEEAEANNWSASETAAAWYDTNDDGKADTKDAPSSFTFNRLRVGLAGEDKLLIVAEGTLMALEAVQQMRAAYDSSGGLTGLTPVTDEEGEPVYSFQPRQTNGAYDTTNGVYALSFGMGSQGIGSAALYLSNYDLTPGSTMNASVSFVNSGDVAIRAGKSQPASITLYAGEEKLAEWQITENVRAGQEVYTASTFVTLPAGLKAGDKLYFTVNEDTSYTGSDAFSQSTKTADGAADTAACITVADRVELGYEDFDITMVGADENTVTLAADIHVGNRGSATSDMTYLRFQYEKVNSQGETELYPVDLTGHKLSVSDESPISRFSRDERTLKNGYLLLRTMQDGVETTDATKAGQIRSMYGRTVTGTFTVPKNWYDPNYGTGSLNLRVTIESYNASDDENIEYNAANNVKLHSVEPETLFTTVSSVNMQVGSTLRLPLTMQTSTKTAPTVTVTELTDDGTRNLSVLYYDVNQGAVVVMPAQAGEGKIRVADTATNSFHDICYKVEGEGVALNIYDDNGIFTWYNASGNAGDAGHNAWDFVKALVWSEDLQTPPLRSDLAVACEGDSFSFQTLADSINLYFMGTNTVMPVEIEVSSNLSGFGTKTYSSANGETPVTISFGNSESVAHTVTIKAKSGEVRFDRLEETFSESLNIQTDPTAPGVYWNRTIPKAASIRQGETVNLTAYFADLGGLVSVTMNGSDVSGQLEKDGDELWFLPMTITENGSCRFVVTDTAGNTTTRDLSVDWFSATLTESTDPGAPEITAQLTKEDGTPIPATVPGDMQVMLKVTDGSGNAVEATISQYQYNDPKSPTSQYFAPCEDMEPNEDTLYPVLRGVYRAAVKGEGGVTSYRFVNLDERDSNAPVASLSKNADGTALIYAVEKFASDSDEMTQITSIRLNDLELLKTDESGYRFSGSYVLTHGGSYVLTATDEAGNKGVSGEVEVDPFPIVLPESAISITKVTETSSTDEKGQTVYTSNSDGKVTIDLSQITGGVYDSEASKAAGKAAGSYEFALLPVTGKDTPVPDEDTQWKKADQLTGLDVGDYALYVRDANEPTVITVPIPITVEFLRVIIHDVATTYAPNGSITVTATGGIGALEYAIYNLNLESSGKLTINNQGTPNDDSDDTVDTVQSDGTIVSRALWQETNTLTELPYGKYIVQVRDSNNHVNCAEREVHVNVRPSGSAVNSVTVPEQPEHGTISVSPSSASEGKTVTITITPDEGYGVRSVTVTGKNGKNISVTALDNGKYSFIMPSTAVTIEAELVPLRDIITFTDVPANAYYADAVNWAVLNGVTKGTSETTFSPDASCTRTQAVTFLWRAAGSPAPKSSAMPFTDVDAGAYYHDAVLWAVEQDITNGTSDTAFRPNATCTRAQIVTFLWRSQASPAAGAVNPFADVADNAYYAEAVKWAVLEGVTSGTTATTFSPNDSCTRAQIVTFLYRCLS